jgi:hypothetical protein
MVQFNMFQQLPPAPLPVRVLEDLIAEATLHTCRRSLLPEMYETVGEPLSEVRESPEASQKVEGTLEDGRCRGSQDAVRTFLKPHML